MLELKEQSENIKKIKNGLCPYCERKLKPSVRYDKRIGEYHVQECRYCKIEIKVSDIKNNTIPKRFNEKYQEKKDKEHADLLTNYKHTPIPKKCAYCGSKQVHRYPKDNTWECDKCNDLFKWRWYEVHFTGDITVAAENEEEAKYIAYENTGDLYVDFVREVD